MRKNNVTPTNDQAPGFFSIFQLGELAPSRVRSREQYRGQHRTWSEIRSRDWSGARIDHSLPTSFSRLDGCVNKQLKSPHGCRASRPEVPERPARTSAWPPDTRARYVSPQEVGTPGA